MPKTWGEKNQIRNREVENIKPLIIAECNRLVHLLNQYEFGDDPWYHKRAEIKAKMKELRRDTLTLERIMINANWYGDDI